MRTTILHPGRRPGSMAAEEIQKQLKPQSKRTSSVIIDRLKYRLSRPRFLEREDNDV
jgi:hypothetical protein